MSDHERRAIPAWSHVSGVWARKIGYPRLRFPRSVGVRRSEQVQRPLLREQPTCTTEDADVRVGGMTLAPIVILITLPVLISLFSRNYRRSLRHQPAQ